MIERARFIVASALLQIISEVPLAIASSVSPALNLRREVDSRADSILNQSTKEYSPVLERVKEREGSVVREREREEGKQVPPFDHTSPLSQICSSALGPVRVGAVPPLS